MKLEMASTLTAGRPGSDISFTNSVTLDLFKLQMSMGDKELASVLDMKWLNRLCSILVFSDKCIAYSLNPYFLSTLCQALVIGWPAFIPNPFCLTHLQPAWVKEWPVTQLYIIRQREIYWMAFGKEDSYPMKGEGLIRIDIFHPSQPFLSIFGCAYVAIWHLELWQPPWNHVVTSLGMKSHYAKHGGDEGWNIVGSWRFHWVDLPILE